jgi:polysaccharide chain length determinant protein (PEP-CTERM system associated)
MENEFDYRKYLTLLNRHKSLFAITALAIMTVAVVLCYVLPKKYEAQSTFFVEKNILMDLINGNMRNDDTQEALKGLDYAIKSRSLLLKVINDLDLNLNKMDDTRLESLIMSLQKRTNVSINAKEGLITVTFIDKSPRLARDYVNTLVRRYLENILSTKRDESYGASSFLTDQVASAKEKLDKVESDIANLRVKYGPAIEMAPGAMPVDNGAGQQRLDELILRRTQLEATRNQLRTNNPAKIRLAALQRRLEELRVEYTDNYPEVIKVKADIEAARQEAKSSTATVADPQELAKVEAELSAVRISEANQRAINGRGVMQANPMARAALDSLLQERNSLRASYDQLVGRQTQAEMTKQMTVQDKSTTFRIVDPAVMPLFPKSPNRLKFILIGIAAGLAGGFALLLALDYVDKSVKNVDTLKNLGINLLAVIPRISDPRTAEIELLKDRKLYLAAGSYFSLILTILALEFIGFSPVDNLIRLIGG